MPQMTLSPQESQLAKEILLFFEQKDFVLVFFPQRVAKAIQLVHRNPLKRFLQLDRTAFLMTFCIGKYLIKKSEQTTLLYQTELDKCIDNKTMQLKNIEHRKRFIPVNWNELWGFTQNVDQSLPSLPKL